jgi:hypothetical protein
LRLWLFASGFSKKVLSWIRVPAASRKQNDKEEKKWKRKWDMRTKALETLIAFLEGIENRIEERKGYTEEEYSYAAGKYTGGRSIEDALSETQRLHVRWRVLLNELGEGEVNSGSARAKTEMYIVLLEEILRKGLDASISVKLTSLGLVHSQAEAYLNLETLLEAAKEVGRTVEVDMEQRTYVASTIGIARALLEEGYSFRLALQAGLRRSLDDAVDLVRVAKKSKSQIGFRLVTGSCYAKNGKGYESTLELDRPETDRAFSALMQLAYENALDNGLTSSVGTFDIGRLGEAARLELRLQALKGYEDKAGYRFIEASKARKDLYLPFGMSQSYLKRRLDSERNARK